MSCRIPPDFVRDMQRDPNGGSTHLGRDGVLRTLSTEYQVVDARALNPDQIKQVLDFLPSVMDKDGFDGVDGTKVPKEQWYNPADGILPQKPTDEEREARRKAIKEANEARIRDKNTV
ncbi:hypothetical protein M441DRAFT_70047 [Trichoderma asperellum CBS 433.97]|uniref:Uncharacterized protein n=1 Tax=Trichoderma asperellum (strain ATCC 204424 / CBS 433.97 / NBRC 101777) TaxID=1042311 RepID=A0A2T3Z640_TRIA4|nr:hypothetical protein M441DRAFT_70047 [Trichoderma asperellum CBS 433.97]PTB40220.1 hypothetical protein M441DRAFT_70047 [Trichoderma asperellum CBS 433.97]